MYRWPPPFTFTETALSTMSTGALVNGISRPNRSGSSLASSIISSVTKGMANTGTLNSSSSSMLKGRRSMSKGPSGSPLAAAPHVSSTASAAINGSTTGRMDSIGTGPVTEGRWSTDTTSRAEARALHGGRSLGLQLGRGQHAVQPTEASDRQPWHLPASAPGQRRGSSLAVAPPRRRCTSGKVEGGLVSLAAFIPGTFWSWRSRALAPRHAPVFSGVRRDAPTRSRANVSQTSETEPKRTEPKAPARSERRGGRVRKRRWHYGLRRVLATCKRPHAHAGQERGRSAKRERASARARLSPLAACCCALLP
eukprot:scaffold1676_cov373-Prasinococcus_capsulatus_cf.AAC.7